MTYTVHISDEKSPDYFENHKFFNERHVWAKEQCESYNGMQVVDVSDTSLYYDEVAEYRFGEERDKLLFVMKWL